MRVCVRDPGEGADRFDILVVPRKTPYELGMFAWMRKKVLMRLGGGMSSLWCGREAEVEVLGW